MRFAIFFVIALLLLGGMALFVSRRTSSVFALSVRNSRILLGTMLGGILLMLLKRYAGDSGVERFLGVAGGSITLATIMTFVLMMAAYWLERSATFTAQLAGVSTKSTEPARPGSEASATEQHNEEQGTRELSPAAALAAEPPERGVSSLMPEPSRNLDEHPVFGRRGFLAKAGTGTALAVGASTSMYAGIFGRHDYVIEEVPIKLAQLPPSLDGFTIVQLSDIHVGTFVGDRELRSALALVDKAKPDLIVLTGDLLDHDKDYGPALGELARRLGERAPLVAVVGNHDYYAGVHATMYAIRGAGGEVLLNQGKLIGEGKLALLGVDDVWAHNRYPGAGPDIHSALATVPQDVPRILLCHNPVYFPNASPHVDLQLSGHTHGGQINLGVRPAELLLPYVEGHYRRDHAQLWVNRGFGTAGPPARLQAAPEVTKLILTV